MSCTEVVPFWYSVNLLLAEWMLYWDNVAQCMSHNDSKGYRMVLCSEKGLYLTYKFHFDSSHAHLTEHKTEWARSYLFAISQTMWMLHLIWYSMSTSNIKTVLTYKQNNFTCSGAMTPGQLGWTRQHLNCFSTSCFNLTISYCGTPATHTISGISAWIPSIIGFAAPGGGT
jgi:hypothetical protein